MKISENRIAGKQTELELILAGEEEEFFYVRTDEPVPEGEPVGLETFDDKAKTAYLFLFDTIYHEFK